MPPIFPSALPFTPLLRLFNQITKPVIFNTYSHNFSRTRTTLSLINPSTATSLPSVLSSTPVDVSSAVHAAQKALHGNWGQLSGAERREVLRDIADAIEKRLKDFVQVEITNAGMVKKDAIDEVNEAVECFRFFAGYADKRYGTSYSALSRIYHSYKVPSPYGITALITPFNYPLLLACWKLAPALACGNTVLLKPAPQTPLAALLLGKVIEDVGVDKGVVNVLPGGRDVGLEVVKNEHVKMVSFTGSLKGGREVLRTIGNEDENSTPKSIYGSRVNHSNAMEFTKPTATLKKMLLELGGNAPLIVFPDVDLSAAVEDVIMASFSNAGQNCCAGKRLYIHQDVYSKFLDKLYDRVKSLRVDNADKEDTEVGPVISETALNEIVEWVEREIEAKKVEVIYGGKRMERKGFFVYPTLLKPTTNDANVGYDAGEVFGPVLTVMSFRSMEEVVASANLSGYGLAAGVWTSDFARAEYCISKLNAGVVWVNCYNATHPYLCFGGMGNSGFGRELGVEAMKEYSVLKSICVRRGKL
ncbi:9972_t:CDS:2 [Paraglomus occultum]|uniref:9972_t:CDS:1 n=1 Tax=Paraglomus occultum TaxID=144539 RepID=A0A9N9A566_9GLOM|nr:9972_t:CDS:2 [Paraglomus occultum]